MPKKRKNVTFASEVVFNEKKHKDEAPAVPSAPVDQLNSLKESISNLVDSISARTPSTEATETKDSVPSSTAAAFAAAEATDLSSLFDARAAAILDKLTSAQPPAAAEPAAMPAQPSRSAAAIAAAEVTDLSSLFDAGAVAILDRLTSAPQPAAAEPAVMPPQPSRSAAAIADAKRGASFITPCFLKFEELAFEASRISSTRAALASIGLFSPEEKSTCTLPVIPAAAAASDAASPVSNKTTFRECIRDVRKKTQSTRANATVTDTDQLSDYIPLTMTPTQTF